MVKIVTDIVDQEIPLLLSRESMKKVSMFINFKEDTDNVLGQDNPPNRHPIWTLYNANRQNVKDYAANSNAT